MKESNNKWTYPIMACEYLSFRSSEDVADATTAWTAGHYIQVYHGKHENCMTTGG